MVDTIIEFIRLATVGLIAGLFTSAMANRDYRHRKWWELRVIAYQNAIEAMSDLIYYYDKHYNAAIEYRELPKETQDRLTTNWHTAYPKIRKAADSGAFLFSDKANSALQNFMKQEDYLSWQENLDNNLFKARNCLTALVECSKSDLKLRQGWLSKLIPS